MYCKKINKNQSKNNNQILILYNVKLKFNIVFNVLNKLIKYKKIIKLNLIKLKNKN